MLISQAGHCSNACQAPAGGRRCGLCCCAAFLHGGSATAPATTSKARGGRPQRKCQGWRGGVNPSTFPFRVPNNKCQPHGSCIGWGPSPEAAPGRWTRSMVPSSSSRADWASASPPRPEGELLGHRVPLGGSGGKQKGGTRDDTPQWPGKQYSVSKNAYSVSSVADSLSLECLLLFL